MNNIFSLLLAAGQHFWTNLFWTNAFLDKYFFGQIPFWTNERHLEKGKITMILKRSSKYGAIR